MKNYIIILLLISSFIGNAQIITSDPKKDKNEPVEKKAVIEKTKSGIEIYLGVSPAYTYRTLSTNDGLFAQPIGYRENETAKWTTGFRSEEHTSELQSRPHLVCRLLLEKKNM